MRFAKPVAFFLKQVKSSDSPLSERKTSLIQRTEEPGAVRSEERDNRAGDYSPEAAPWERKANRGMRNLVLGALIILVAIALMGQAIYLAGPDAMIPILAALVTVVTLFVVSRLRLLRQRNGGFLGLGLVCLLAASLSLAQIAWKRTSGPRVAASGASTIDRQEDTGDKEMPRLTEAFTVPAITEDTERFKVLRDFQVEMADGKAYLIKAGEVLPVAEKAEGEVRFLADNQKIGLPEKMVEMLPAGADTTQDDAPPAPASALPGMATVPAGDTPPATEDQPETPAQITERSQKEAIRRYPALGQRDSPENQLFIETFQELKHTGADDFFADPEWPLQLAELLAKRENWQRQE